MKNQLAPALSNAGYSIFEIASTLVGSFFLRFLLLLNIFSLTVENCELLNYILKNNKFIVNGGQCYYSCKKERKKEKTPNYITFHILLLKIMSPVKNLSLSGPFFSRYMGIVSYVHIRLEAH